ncbi:MAG: 50S ribosomal protein L30 [Acidimicrobiia bacterium]
MAAGTVKVTLRRSLIGEKPGTVKTVKGLGLGKLNSSNELPDNAATRGMIHKVRHLVEVASFDEPKTRDQRQEISK